MRLLNTTSLELHEFSSNIPPYAILSHVWEADEVLFHEIKTITKSVKSKAGFKKIESFCTVAKSLEFDYAWIDSCNIDKTSSAELTESLNSMYKWYHNAALCIVYLADVPTHGEKGVELNDGQIDKIKKSRWFTRGWTLQELVASKNRRFYSSDWSEISIAPSKSLPMKLISDITGIEVNVLQNRDLMPKVCVAKRMSWASRRETTKSEDAAYSLMGLFNVNMPILYGEGLRKAFRRLQDEIMKTSFDQSLFAWRGNYERSGLLAHYPSDFKDTPELGLWGRDMMSPFSMTNVGLLIRPCIFIGKESTVGAALGPDAYRLLGEETSYRIPKSVTYLQAALQCDVKTEKGWKILLLHLQPVEDAGCWVNDRLLRAYRRIHCDTFEAMPEDWLKEEDSMYEDVVILEDEHFMYLVASEDAHNARQDEDNFPSDSLETLKIGDSP